MIWDMSKVIYFWNKDRKLEKNIFWKKTRSANSRHLQAINCRLKGSDSLADVNV